MNKINTKLSLAIMALVGIGVFALPQTVALFSGQHSFYNIDATGNQIPCIKCHGDVKEELLSGGSTTTGTKGPHVEFKCEYCHRVEAGTASGDNAIGLLIYLGKFNPSVKLFLATSVANVEAQNYPYKIIGAVGLTVDNWYTQCGATCVFSDDAGTGWHEIQFFQNNGKYAGVLSRSIPGGIYIFNRSAIVPAFNKDVRDRIVPKDQNVSTQDGALDPRSLTFNDNYTSETGDLINFNGSGSKEVTPGTKYHAASLVSCMECHGGEQPRGDMEYNMSQPYRHGMLIDQEDPNSKCSNCHYGDIQDTPEFETNFEAGGFGLTNNANDTGSTEAHNDFVRANGGVLRRNYGAANDACVSCHTHVPVSINFQKKYALKFDANAFSSTNGNGTGHGNWSVGGFGAQGTVNVETYGNGTGNTFAISNHSYNWNPDKTIYIVNSNGTQGNQVLGLTNSSNDTSTSLISVS